MKQNITAMEWGRYERQVPEYANKLQEYYSEWQRQHENVLEGFVSRKYDPIFLWFTVGQMIEFMDYNCSWWWITFDNDTGTYIVATTNRKNVVGEADELCDALWEACRDILYHL